MDAPAPKDDALSIQVTLERTGFLLQHGPAPLARWRLLDRRLPRRFPVAIIREQSIRSLKDSHRSGLRAARYCHVSFDELDDPTRKLLLCRGKQSGVIRFRSV